MRTHLLTLLCILGVSFLGLGQLSTPLDRNLRAVDIIKLWMRAIPSDMSAYDMLHDGLPDGWNPHVWGGATAVIRLEEDERDPNNSILVMEHTNEQGVAAVFQSFSAVPDTELTAIVHTKGDGGALQLRFYDDASSELPGSSWLDVMPSAEWQRQQLRAVVPDGAQTVSLYLRSDSGTILWDEAYLDNSGSLSVEANRLFNPGFDQDGNDIDPLLWWEIHSQVLPTVPEASGSLTTMRSFHNIVDMINADYERIRDRSMQLEQCAFNAEMTNWLVILGERVEQRGGKAAREKVYQLAIELMPNCPQPYAALAHLYETNNAFWAAVGLYHEASRLAGNTVYAGRYAFHEGIIHTRHTGLTKNAIHALEKAERLTGWESAPWYFGVASMLLGENFEAERRLDDAAAAYYRVLECGLCRYHHENAQRRLDALVAID